MRIYPNVFQSAVAPEVVIEHNGDQLTFSVSSYGRGSFQEGFDVFQYINMYWADLTHEKQDKIFKLYQDIDYVFTCSHHTNELVDNLNSLIRLLLGEHEIEKVKFWIDLRANIVIPESVKPDFKHNIDDNRTEDKTYTIQEYKRLISLSLVLKTLVPLWGQYIFQCKRDTGTDNKEFEAFRIIENTKLLEDSVFRKLRTYVKNIAKSNLSNPNNILKSISSLDYDYWLMCLVCVRRISVADISGCSPDGKNIITTVYKFIIQKVTATECDFENLVQPKTHDDTSSDGDGSKASALERYRVKSILPLGDIVAFEVAVSDPRRVADQLAIGMDREALERSLLSCQKLIDHDLKEPQINMLRWVMSRVIAPEAISYLPKNIVVNLIGVMEAVLWHHGHRYLALLSSSYAVVSDKEMIVSPVDSKMRISKDVLDRLDELFIYARYEVKRDAKVMSRVVDSIEALAKNLTMHAWFPTCEHTLLKEVFNNPPRHIPIRPQIKSDIAALVIDLATQKWI